MDRRLAKKAKIEKALDWRDNVSEKASVVTCQCDKRTVKKFKLDYKTLDVVEVE